jgi:8-oxo-dGTP pyrophosphatase MutT (NUDIX family)
MSLVVWERLKRDTLLKASIFTAHKDRVRVPADGREFDLFVLESPDWVNVIALTETERLVLVRQYRHGTGRLTVEIPGGMVDPGETPLEAARRELREETGYEAEGFEQLGLVEPNPAFQTNRTYTFLARGARRVGVQQLDAQEEVEVFERPLCEVPKMLTDGTITHALVFCAFCHLALHGGLDGLTRPAQ